jgi:hypothetical protein
MGRAASPSRMECTQSSARYGFASIARTAPIGCALRQSGIRLERTRSVKNRSATDVRPPNRPVLLS